MKTTVLVIVLVFSLAVVAGEKEEIDWKVKCEKKVGEVDGVLEILAPVVEFLTESFENNTFSETTTEEWTDAVKQFTSGNKKYEQAKGWLKEGKYEKLTFLKLEEAWQYYVKTGVAGLRAKEMVAQELAAKTAKPIEK